MRLVDASGLSAHYSIITEVLGRNQQSVAIHALGKLNMTSNDKKSRISDSSAELYTDGSYLKNNPTWGVEDSPWKAAQISTILSKNRIAPKTIGEIGCGAGEILKQLSFSYPDTEFYGFEISPQAFELSKNRSSEKIQFHLKNLLDEDKFFDTLLCIDVFEHVEDYFGFIRQIKNKAEYKIFHIPLDISVLSVIRTQMMVAREGVGHLHYFSKETALATLKDCGYEIIDSFYTTAFNDIPAKKLRTHLARIPRKLLYGISHDWGARLLGGSSLLVLAK